MQRDKLNCMLQNNVEWLQNKKKHTLTHFFGSSNAVNSHKTNSTAFLTVHLTFRSLHNSAPCTCVRVCEREQQHPFPRRATRSNITVTDKKNNTQLCWITERLCFDSDHWKSLSIQNREWMRCSTNLHLVHKKLCRDVLISMKCIDLSL